MVKLQTVDKISKLQSPLVMEQEITATGGNNEGVNLVTTLNKDAQPDQETLQQLSQTALLTSAGNLSIDNDPFACIFSDATLVNDSHVITSIAGDEIASNILDLAVMPATETSGKSIPSADVVSVDLQSFTNASSFHSLMTETSDAGDDNRGMLFEDEISLNSSGSEQSRSNDFSTKTAFMPSRAKLLELIDQKKISDSSHIGAAGDHSPVVPATDQKSDTSPLRSGEDSEIITTDENRETRSRRSSGMRKTDEREAVFQLTPDETLEFEVNEEVYDLVDGGAVDTRGGKASQLPALDLEVQTLGIALHFPIDESTSLQQDTSFIESVSSTIFEDEEKRFEEKGIYDNTSPTLIEKRFNSPVEVTNQSEGIPIDKENKILDSDLHFGDFDMSFSTILAGTDSTLLTEDHTDTIEVKGGPTVENILDYPMDFNKGATVSGTSPLLTLTENSTEHDTDMIHLNMISNTEEADVSLTQDTSFQSLDPVLDPKQFQGQKMDLGSVQFPILTNTSIPDMQLPSMHEVSDIATLPVDAQSPLTTLSTIGINDGDDLTLMKDTDLNIYTDNSEHIQASTDIHDEKFGDENFLDVDGFTGETLDLRLNEIETQIVRDTQEVKSIFDAVSHVGAGRSVGSGFHDEKKVDVNDMGVVEVDFDQLPDRSIRGTKHMDRADDVNENSGVTDNENANILVRDTGSKDVSLLTEIEELNDSNICAAFTESASIGIILNSYENKESFTDGNFHVEEEEIVSVHQKNHQKSETIRTVLPSFVKIEDIEIPPNMMEDLTLNQEGKPHHAVNEFVSFDKDEKLCSDDINKNEVKEIDEEIQNGDEDDEWDDFETADAILVQDPSTFSTFNMVSQQDTTSASNNYTQSIKFTESAAESLDRSPACTSMRSTDEKETDHFSYTAPPTSDQVVKILIVLAAPPSQRHQFYEPNLCTDINVFVQFFDIQATTDKYAYYREQTTAIFGMCPPTTSPMSGRIGSEPVRYARQSGESSLYFTVGHADVITNAI